MRPKKKKKIAGMQKKAKSRIFQKKPALPFNPNVDLYLNLGVNHSNQGSYGEAAACFKKVLSLDPTCFTAHYNLGYVLQEQGEFDESIDCFKRTLSIKPNHLDALYNLGVVYLQQDKFEEAATYFKTVLGINPEHLKAYNNMCVVYTQQGRYEEAANYIKKALSVHPSVSETHYRLGCIRIAQARDEDAGTCFKAALALRPDYPEPRTYLAINCWINREWDACKDHLDRISKSKKILGEEDLKFVVPYSNFLGKLLKFRETNTTQYTKSHNLPVIYAVGDSHCLSTVNTIVNFQGVKYQVAAKLVTGCKAWHLGNKVRNIYKHEFEKRLESIPIGATAIFMFGEIDCRPDEGIMKHYKKYHVNLTEAIVTLVENYFNYVSRLAASRNISPMICNIPKQIIDKDIVSDTDIKLHKKILATFNKALEDNVSRKQIPLLDVYSFLRAQEGDSYHEHYIDRNHLRPSVLKHLIKEL